MTFELVRHTQSIVDLFFPASRRYQDFVVPATYSEETNAKGIE